MVVETGTCQLLFFTLSVMLATNLQAQVALADTAFLNNNENWKPNVSFSRFGNNLLRKASFAAFQIVSVEKGNQTTQAYSQNKGLTIGSDGSGFVKTTREEKVRPYLLTIVADDGDTVLVSMSMVEWVRRERTTFRLSKQAPSGSVEKNVYCQNMSIQLPGDSLPWTWQGKPWREDGVPYNEPMNLLHGNSAGLVVAYAKGLRKGSRGWNDHFPDGLVFSKDGVQLGALQTDLPRAVWLKKELDKSLKRVIAAAILGVLSNDGQPPQILPLGN